MPDWFLLSPFKAALIGLTMYTAAYTAEALRSGLISIDKGQTEAARSVGLNYVQTRIYVVAPQALRVAVPLLELFDAQGLTERLPDDRRRVRPGHG